jgi:hypothetical protein
MVEEAVFLVNSIRVGAERSGLYKCTSVRVLRLNEVTLQMTTKIEELLKLEPVLPLALSAYPSSAESVLPRLTNDGCIARPSMDHHVSSSRLALACHASPSPSSYLPG